MNKITIELAGNGLNYLSYEKTISFAPDMLDVVNNAGQTVEHLTDIRMADMLGNHVVIGVNRFSKEVIIAMNQIKKFSADHYNCQLSTWQAVLN